MIPCGVSWSYVANELFDKNWRSIENYLDWSNIVPEFYFRSASEFSWVVIGP